MFFAFRLLLARKVVGVVVDGVMGRWLFWSWLGLGDVGWLSKFLVVWGRVWLGLGVFSVLAAKNAIGGKDSKEFSGASGRQIQGTCRARASS